MGLLAFSKRSGYLTVTGFRPLPSCQCLRRSGAGCPSRSTLMVRAVLCFGSTCGGRSSPTGMRGRQAPLLCRTIAVCELDSSTETQRPSFRYLTMLGSLLPAVEELERAPWPRLRNTLARGILAATLRGGGRDFADGTPANRDSLSKREYHHLFPAALLRNDGCLDESQINLALNCALVTWNTNRNISAKEPVAYLRERVQRAPLGEEQIRSRLNSHIIPFEELNAGGYSDICGEEIRGSENQI